MKERDQTSEENGAYAGHNADQKRHQIEGQWIEQPPWPRHACVDPLCRSHENHRHPCWRAPRSPYNSLAKRDR